jgi:hypothetical protein
MSVASVFYSAVARQSRVRIIRALYIASNHRIKLHELFLLPVYSQKMSVASVLIPMWQGSLVRTSQAPDHASSRRIILELLLLSLLQVYFQR